MPDVLVVQPSCPTYRVEFFESVCARVDMHLIASDVSIDGAATDLKDSVLPVTMVKCFNLPRGTGWQRGIIPALLKDRPRILVINGNPRYLSSIAAALLARAMRIKVVWWGHSISSTSRPWRSFLRMQMMRLANRVFLYYPEEIGRLPARLRGRSIGLDNSVDTRKSLSVDSSLGDGEIDLFRAAKGLEGLTVLVMIGRLNEKACAHLLLQALASLKTHDDGLHLVFVGTGPEEPRLRQLAKELCVSTNVTFAGPVYDERQIGLWLRCATLFVYGGAVGLSLIHAFCYALPAIIRSPLSAHSPEAVLFENGKHGLTFEKGSVPSLVRTITGALEGRESLREMGINAQLLVKQRLSIEKMADNFVRGLEEIETSRR